MSTQKKVNGNVNLLNEQQEAMRAQVVDLELKARYWEAMFNIRKFTLASSEINDDYQAYVDKENEKNQKMLEEIRKQSEDSNGQLKVEELTAEALINSAAALSQQEQVTKED